MSDDIQFPNPGSEGKFTRSSTRSFNSCLATDGKQSTTTNDTTNGSHHVIAAIVEGRGAAKGEVGIASMDGKSNVLCISQFSDSAAYSRLRMKLHSLQPVEIIFPDSMCGKRNNMDALMNQLQSEFLQVKMTSLHRKHFSETRGLEVIRNLNVPECSSSEKEFGTKYYCLACVAGLIRYIEFIENIAFAPCSMKIVFSGVDQCCFIDPTTSRNLELLLNAQSCETNMSLFGVLNHVHTPGGSRLLRSNILQPLAQAEAINLRLDAIEDCFANFDAFEALKNLMGRIQNVEHFIMLCSRFDKNDSIRLIEFKLSQIIALKQTLELMEPLCDCLKCFTNPLFRTILEALSDDRLKLITGCIKLLMHDEVHIAPGSLAMRMQKVFAIRSGLHGMLDIARRTYNEILDDVFKLCREVSEETKLGFSVNYSNSRGFYLNLSLKAGEVLPKTLPSVLINVVKLRSALTCSTRSLVRLNDRIQETVSNIFFLSSGILTGFFAEVRPLIGCLYTLAECSAMLDVIVALVTAAQQGQYVRPTFGTDLIIEQGKHPILDRFSSDSIVANDIQATAGQNFVLITGPNMAGKSTCLKQIALLQVMAQIGSFVPAISASFPITKQIFSRIGSNDDFETGSSAFIVEMKDVNYVLRNANSESLIVIDELGRSATCEEGIAFCFAVSEALLRLKATVFFATHFLELAKLESMYCPVVNYHFGKQTETVRVQDGQEERSEEHLRLNHKIHPGVYDGEPYGFEIIEMAKYPTSIVTRAKDLVSGMMAEQKKLITGDGELRKRKLTFHFGSRLANIVKFCTSDQSNMSKEEIAALLNQLKQEYSSELNALQDMEMPDGLE